MNEKIVFLDSSTVDFGDIDFSALQALGGLKCHTVTSHGEAAERCKEATIAITNKVVFDAEIISKCPNLKMIAEAATGYNNIDISEAKKRNITVANVPGYSTPTVAQLTMAFILAQSTNLIKYNQASHDGTWSRSDIFTLGTWPFFDLEGKTIGIMGLGAIGKEVARLCRAFGMNVAALKRGTDAAESPVPRLDLYDMAAESDFISIHMPLTDYSKNLINREFFSHMKKSAFLINMARGPIVEPSALCHALENGIIAGAAIDVMEKEPPAADDPLLKAPNLIITPHIAWASVESRRRLVSEVAENIKGFLGGVKRNVVSG
ncbi:MAG TPA: D-2-hydroxyacid dehydrogenase [Spirochaetota bacterium]|nr:D-2-hydroxyacid dehydrogenase [Spirochaetota bacterium]HPS86431.1 D-2-hydroxyacid dehydrogenase [Spirochaetota bacterium]